MELGICARCFGPEGLLRCLSQIIARSKSLSLFSAALRLSGSFWEDTNVEVYAIISVSFPISFDRGAGDSCLRFPCFGLPRASYCDKSGRETRDLVRPQGGGTR